MHQGIMQVGRIDTKTLSGDLFVQDGFISKQVSHLIRVAMARTAAFASRTGKRWYPIHEDLVLLYSKKAVNVVI
jgi:hypothetical protein